jgi:Arc/MetJ-type ribon-helix-helix transcriptional regulator
MTTNTGNFTEKVSVNINTTTLAAIDLLIDNGHYFNRSDFINQALREAIARNEANIQRASEESGKKLTGGYWFMGVSRLTEPEVDEILRSGKPRSISGYGVLSVDPNIPAEKVFAAISEISIRGKVSCSPEVREHYNL